MLDTIQQAAENFCIHQIREPHKLQKEPVEKRTLIAYIDIDTENQKKYRVYVASNEAFMQKVANLFLEEENSDEETLKDMTLETANLIIGSAKVIAQETNKNPYTIGTPKFEKIGTFNSQTDESITLSMEDKELTIAIKEIDA